MTNSELVKMVGYTEIATGKCWICINFSTFGVWLFKAALGILVNYILGLQGDGFLAPWSFCRPTLEAGR